MIRGADKRMQLGRELGDLLSVRARPRNPLSEYRALVMEGNPVAYWPLDDASGLPQDYSGNGRHMTAVSGSPTYGNLSLLGRGFINYPSTAFHERAVVSTATANMYVEMWVRRTGNASTDLFRHGTTSGGFELEFTAASGAFRGNLPGVGTLGAIGQIFPDEWFYLVAGRGATTWSSWLNLVEHTSTFGTGTPGTPVGNTRIIGAAATGIEWAHVAFYESAPLSHADLIEARFAAMSRWLYQ